MLRVTIKGRLSITPMEVKKISFWRTTGLIVGIPLLILSAVVAAESDDEDSKNDYPGRCRHEYDIAADGSRCGLRSADSRLGGY
ncbi:hypothetical protein [Pectobacterium brasiliense]|uniref:hypothetical protein n=1 Tax=Pectobacterium brasiliense TaxID=180957 RepID=UPI001968EB94|nr:hypothetical protein [Pectobacterium brasiliense]MBN3124574.1 hypothetical protein [Pectobacterium brasiliense]